MEETKVSATLKPFVNLEISLADRTYTLIIPNNAAHEEAQWVCNEMLRLIGELKEKAAAAKAAAETAAEEVIPEVVS